MDKRNGLNKSIVIFLLLVLLVGIVIFLKNKADEKYEYKIEKITQNDVKYYLLIENEKYGVIDENGEKIVDTKFEKIDIPNPTKDYFVVTEAENKKSYVINKENKLVLSNYSYVEAIHIKRGYDFIPYEKTVLKYKDNNLYGIIDFSSKKITEPVFEDISSLEYKEGNLLVKKNGKYGVINIKGTEIVKTEYDEILADGYYDKKDGYKNAGFILKTRTDYGYKLGYVDRKGKKILEQNYSNIIRLTEMETNDIYLLNYNNGKVGLNKNGKQLLEIEYDDLNFNFNNKLLISKKNVSKGVFDIEGKTILPIDYDDITIGGKYINTTKGNETIIFDVKGNKIDTNFISYNEVNNRFAIIIDQNNTYNIVDRSGNKILREEYAYIEYFKDDYFIVSKDGYTGVIDQNGTPIVPIEFSTIKKIENTNILEATKNSVNEIFIIDENLKVIKGLKNARTEVNESYIKIISDKEVKYFNLKGEEKSYKDLFNNKTLYAYNSNGKWGFVNSQGNIIVDPIYDFVTEQENNVVGYKEKGKWGVMDLSGKKLTDAIYNIDELDVVFLGKFYGVVDKPGSVQIYTNYIEK